MKNKVNYIKFNNLKIKTIKLHKEINKCNNIKVTNNYKIKTFIKKKIYKNKEDSVEWNFQNSHKIKIFSME